jgi:lysozyme
MESATDKYKRIKSALAIATAIAIPAEGLRQYAYYDPPGILTVCYGHTGNDFKKGVKYDIEQCKQWLDDDMLFAVMAVERCVPGLPDNVLAAFSDAVFNIGPRIACDKNRSTAARLLAQGKITEACKELPKWNKAKVAGEMIPLPGLTKRRKLEMEICLGGSS